MIHELLTPTIPRFLQKIVSHFLTLQFQFENVGPLMKRLNGKPRDVLFVPRHVVRPFVRLLETMMQIIHCVDGYITMIFCLQMQTLSIDLITLYFAMHSKCCTMCDLIDVLHTPDVCAPMRQGSCCSIISVILTAEYHVCSCLP